MCVAVGLQYETPFSLFEYWFSECVGIRVLCLLRFYTILSYCYYTADLLKEIKKLR